jgi:Ca2+-binding RTX toxin-like protein
MLDRLTNARLVVLDHDSVEIAQGDNVDPTVENVTGGLADDFIVGNELANRLFGGQGSDVLNAVDGISGNDVIDGAQGFGSDSCTADPGDIIQNCP